MDETLSTSAKNNWKSIEKGMKRFKCGGVEEQVNFDRILIRYGVEDGQNYNLQPPK